MHTVRRHLADDRGKILVAIAAGWFLSIGVRVTYPVLLPFIRADYDLSLTAAGLLLTVLWLAYAVGQLPGGILAERIGDGRTMVVSMGITAGTLTIVATAISAPILFIATAALGFGIALFGVVRLTAVSNIYPQRIGTAHGLTSAAGDLGNSLLPPSAGVIAAATIWQLGFGFIVPLFVLVAVTLYVVVPARTAIVRTDRATFTLDNLRYLLTMLSQPAVIGITIVQIMSFSILQAFTGFFPTYLIEIKGLSAFIASGFFALFYVMGVFIKPFSGNAYDRVGIKQSLVVVTVISGLGFVVLPFVNDFWHLAVVTICISTVLGKGTVALAYLTVSLPTDIQNTGMGAVRSTYFMIGATSPLVFGAIADRGFFDEAFLLLAVLSGLSIVLVLQLPRQHNL